MAVSRRRLLFQALLFVALTAAGIAWAVGRSDVRLADFAVLGELGGRTVLALAVLVVAVYGADMLRYRALGHAAGVVVPWRATLNATISAFFFAWITPGATLGAPAAVVMLKRGGVPWGVAGIVSFGKSATGAGLLLGGAFVALALGWGPGMDPAVTGVLVVGSGVVAGALLGFVAAGAFPRPALAMIERVPWPGVQGPLQDAVRRLGQLRPSWIPAVLASHLLYFAAFAGVLVVILRALGAPDPAHASGSSVIYLAFTYVAPTPGGSGLAEASADLFFGDQVTAEAAVVAVLLFRGLTFYLQVVVGAVHVVWLGALHAVLRGDGAEPR